MGGPEPSMNYAPDDIYENLFKSRSAKVDHVMAPIANIKPELKLL